MQEKAYFKNLDGLRFFCFLSVFLYHSFYTEYLSIKSSATYHFIDKDIFGNGNLGVNFFFVLSGFLITFLLIQEKKTNGSISIENFWMRRILRIWPLYFFCVFFGFIIFPVLKQLFGQISAENANPWYYIFLINNFDLIFNKSPDSSVLGVLWSVAIEEQFYFVWPLVLSVVPLKKYWIPFSLVIIGSIVFRAFNLNPDMHELHTLSCIGDMATGAFGAWLVIQSARFKLTIENMNGIFIVLIYFLVLFVFLFREKLLLYYDFIRVFERLFIALIFSFVILEQCYSKKSFYKMSNFKMVSKLGTITYGLYCLHFIGILIAINITKMLDINKYLWQVLLLETLLALGISIMISTISYKFYETPFLNLKKKFSPAEK